MAVTENYFIFPIEIKPWFLKSPYVLEFELPLEIFNIDFTRSNTEKIVQTGIKTPNGTLIEIDLQRYIDPNLVGLNIERTVEVGKVRVGALIHVGLTLETSQLDISAMERSPELEEEPHEPTYLEAYPLYAEEDWCKPKPVISRLRSLFVHAV